MSFDRARSWGRTLKAALASRLGKDTSQEYELWSTGWTTGEIEALLFGTGDTSPAAREPGTPSSGGDAKVPNGGVTLGDPSRPSVGARRLALRLELSARHTEASVMFSGLSEEDGSSVVASQTAVALAQMRVGRIALVDGNLRSPRLQTLYGIPDTPGLLDFLRGRATLEDVFYTPHRDPLSILPTAEATSDDEIMSLLTGPKMTELMSILRKEFRFAVFDSAPITGSADAVLLASLVRRVVMVATRGRRSHAELRQAKRALSDAKADVLGVILS